jgi:hypothetical protein
VHVVVDLPADPQTAEVVQEREGHARRPITECPDRSRVECCGVRSVARCRVRVPVAGTCRGRIAVHEDHVGASAGRPHLPRTGGTTSSSGMRWVTSLQLPSVSVNASGIPVPSVIGSWPDGAGMPDPQPQAPTAKPAPEPTDGSAVLCRGCCVSRGPMPELSAVHLFSEAPPPGPRRQ